MHKLLNKRVGNSAALALIFEISGDRGKIAPRSGTEKKTWH
jgi:hypothetical protein